MSVSTVAGVVGIVGTVAGGVSSYNRSKDALTTQQESSEQATALQQEQLQFQKDTWEAQMQDIADLEAIFGPVKDNIANYYNSMSVEKFQLQNKEQIEKQYEATNKRLDAIFSNNGMYKSGANANARIALEVARETALGESQMKAEQTYSQEQMNWLNYGLQEKNIAKGLSAQSQQLVGGAYSQGVNLATTQGQIGANLNMQQAQGAGQFGTGALQLAGYSAGGGFGSNTTLNNSNTTFNNQPANYETTPGFIGPQRQ